MQMNLHRVEAVELTPIRKMNTPDTGVYYARDLVVRCEGGQRLCITLYGDDAESITCGKGKSQHEHDGTHATSGGPVG